MSLIKKCHETADCLLRTSTAPTAEQLLRRCAERIGDLEVERDGLLATVDRVENERDALGHRLATMEQGDE